MTTESSVAGRLPAGFQDTDATPRQTDAITIFVERARAEVPNVQLVGSRRTSSGHIKIVVEFPDGDCWESLHRLAGIVNDVHQATGVFLNLD